MEIRNVMQQRMPATARYVASQIESVNTHISAEISKLESFCADTDTKFTRLFNQEIASLSKKLSATEELCARLTAEINALKQQTEAGAYGNIEYLQYSVLKQDSRVLLAGWYGAENCGDELMMRAILQHLQQAGIRPTVLLWDYPHYEADDIAAIANIIHYPSSIAQVAQLADLFDVLIWGGGAIIDENQYDTNPCNINTGNLFIRLSEAILNRGKDVYALGLSSTPEIENESFLKKIKRIAKDSKFFSLRDSNSIQTLIKAGISETDLKYLPDPVFAFQEFTSSELLQLPQTNNERLRIGIVFTEFAHMFYEDLRLLQLINDFLTAQEKKFGIVLIPFFGYRNSDPAYYLRLKEHLGNPQWLEIADYSHHLTENSIFGCDYVISYRYHGALLANIAGIPNISICLNHHPHYANKIHFLAQQFAGEANIIDANNFNDTVFLTAFRKLLTEKKKTEPPADILKQTQAKIREICNRIHTELNQ